MKIGGLMDENTINKIVSEIKTREQEQKTSILTKIKAWLQKCETPNWMLIIYFLLFTIAVVKLLLLTWAMSNWAKIIVDTSKYACDICFSINGYK